MMESVKLTGMDNVLDMLKSLPKDVAAKNGGIARKALLRGANIFRKQAAINLASVTANATKSGEQYSTGLTATKVVTARRRMPPGQNGERRVVTVQYKDHPTHKQNYRNKPVTFKDLAFTLEFGTSKQPAEPWLAPAFNQQSSEAINATTENLTKLIDAAAAKLLKSGGS
jgi:HK97 gp10 family phage protein